jgi:hypothetical protein
MTTSTAKSRSVIFGTLGILGILIAAAAGQDVPTAVRETFVQTAERWGLWAALSIGLTGISVIGLVWVVRFTITTMRECIDDNSLSHLHVARVMTQRPCLHDSDAIPDLKELSEDSGPIGETARKVLSRREKLKSKIG